MYHPFNESYLGFLIQPENPKENAVEFIIEDINLYVQPVEEPVAAIVYVILRIIWLFIAELIYFKLFKMVGREKGLVKEVTQLYAITLIISAPIWLFLISITDWIHLVSEVIGKWFCTVGWILTFLSWTIISFHSFVTATMRYFFIVHQEKVKKYGKEKTKRVFLILSFFIPLIVVAWGVTQHPDVDPMWYINRCYGKSHDAFLVDTSSTQTVILESGKRYFWNYDGEETTDNILSILKHTAYMIKAFIMLLMGFNITEGIIYYKTFSHIYR